MHAILINIEVTELFVDFIELFDGIEVIELNQAGDPK